MKLSIITVCLNNRDPLEKTIQSVKEQTWKDFEYIIIDGKSTDGTDLILRRYQDSIDKLVVEKDSGIYNAQNKGILRSEGEYLLFLNAGDVFSGKTALEAFFHADACTADLLYGDILLEKDGKIIGEKIYPDVIPLEYWQRDFLCHQAALHKRTLFEKYGLYNESNRYASDHELFYQVWRDTNSKIKHINSVITIYNLNGITANPAARSRIIAEHKVLLRKYLNLNFKDQSFARKILGRIKTLLTRIIS